MRFFAKPARKFRITKPKGHVTGQIRQFGARGKAKRRRGDDTRKVNGGGDHAFLLGRTSGSARVQFFSLVTRLGSQLE